MKYEEPIMEMFVFMLDDVITGSLDLGDNDSGGDGSGDSGVGDGVEYYDIN